MSVETSFDLERDKCLKILLMFFSASIAKGKKNSKIKSVRNLTDYPTFTRMNIKKKINSRENFKSTNSGTILF